MAHGDKHWYHRAHTAVSQQTECSHSHRKAGKRYGLGMGFSFVRLTSAFLLSACTDSKWNRLTGLDQSSSQEVADPAPPVQAVTDVPPAASTGSSFCQAVAQQDATDNSFDLATQQRIAGDSYAQCVAIYSK